MKKIPEILCISVIWQLLTYGQMTLNNVKSLLPKNRNSIEILQTSPTTVQIKRADNGETLVKSISEPAQQTTADLVIDLTTLDTTQYSARFRYWRELPVLDFLKGLTIADANHNQKKEIYGGFKDFNTDYGIARVYEYAADSSFQMLYQLPDSVGVGMAWGDVDNDGLYEVIFQQSNFPTKSILFTQPNSFSLPTTYRSTFDTVSTSGQPRRINFHDINSDGVQEMIYYLDGGGDIFPPSNQIAVYNTAREKFDIVYYNRPNTTYSAGFTFGDFDLDGKQNIANGGINGELFIYEHMTDNNYSVKLVDTIPTKNAYYSCLTNDLDGNGKPELWMGGDFFSNGVGITRLVVYETTGNDTYTRKYQIDIIGVFSFFAGNMVAADMDNDGKQEVVLCIDQHLLIFKNTGGNTYALWYIKKNDLALAGMNSVWYNVTVTDFDNDQYPELIVGSDIVVNDKLRGFSNVYRKNVLTNIYTPKEILPEEFHLYQNYPNPFNASTTIQYRLPQHSYVTVTIYSILGKEIKTIVNQQQEAGEYRVAWNGSDDHGHEVGSGVYFVRLQTNNFTDTKKILFVK